MLSVDLFAMTYNRKKTTAAQLDPRVFVLLRRINNLKAIIARRSKINYIRLKRYKRGLPDIEILID